MKDASYRLKLIVSFFAPERPPLPVRNFHLDSTVPMPTPTHPTQPCSFALPSTFYVKDQPFLRPLRSPSLKTPLVGTGVGDATAERGDAGCVLSGAAAVDKTIGGTNGMGLTAGIAQSKSQLAQ